MYQNQNINVSLKTNPEVKKEDRWVITADGVRMRYSEFIDMRRNERD